MNRTIHIICLLLLCVCAQAKVVISQIMYDTPLNEQTNRHPYCHGEFVEIYNTGTEDVSLANWKLKGSLFWNVYTFPTNTILPSGASLIVAFKDAKIRKFDLNTLLPSNPDAMPCNILYQHDLILNNLGETLKLVTSTNITEDSISYTNIAANLDGLLYNLCLSLHRVRVTLNQDGSIYSDMNDWAVKPVCRGSDAPIEEFAYSPQSSKVDTLPSLYNYRLIATPLDEVTALSMENGHVTPNTEARIRISCDVFDGLGRPQLTIARRQSTELYNIASLVEYDARNLKTKSWLPVPYEGDNIPSMNVSMTDTKLYYGDNNPYSSVTYEQSPLGRTTAFTKEGDVYQTHPATIAYETNTDNEVIRWQATSNGLLRNGYYEKESLKKTISINEEGKQVIEYKDYLDRLILQKQGANYLWACTYYVYDNYSRLTYVLPPNTLNSLQTDSLYSETYPAIKLFAYVYHYNSRDLLISKKLPGCEPIQMVYDKTGKLILSQDGNQRTRGGFWTYNAYDNTNRLLYKAEVRIDNTDYTSLTQTYKNLNCIEYPTGSSANSNLGYTVSAITADYIKPLCAYFYNDYSYYGNLSHDVSDWLDFHNNDDSDARYLNTKCMLTGMHVYDLSDELSTYYSYYYDINGNPVQTHSVGPDNEYYSLYAKYNYDGTLASSKVINNAHTEIYSYLYDHVGRLRKQMYQLDDNPQVTLTHNFYDKTGHLVQSLSHNGNLKNHYTYDLRSNISTVQSGPFSESIYTVDNLPENTNPLFDGSISAVDKNYSGDHLFYLFQYDALSRITQSSLRNEDGTSPSEISSYDLQGNILSLQRYNDEDLIDNLTYSYNGNQVYSIEESAATLNDMSTYGYIDRSHIDTTIRYDANGNMRMDLDRNITDVKYNILNLPDTIIFSTGDSIINRYNALGEKISRAYHAGNNSRSIIRYNRNIETTYAQIANNSEITKIKEVIHNFEGFYRYDWNSTAPMVSQYYYCRDYLGNNVAVWNASTKQSEQQTMYYVSGLPMNNSTGDNLQAYKYNNKELIAQFGLNEYDSEARYYYPAIGRTTTMDPLAEDYYHISPYAWCGNNWVNVIDLSGEAPVTPAPKEIMGGPYYYYYRNKDYASRHQGIDNDYYKNYGEKYNAKFKFQTKPKLSSLGQKWVDEVALNLQIALENRLQKDDGTEFEASTDFNSYAYKTHVEAYKNENKEGETTPLCVLPLKDVWLIARTPELQDSFGSRQGLKQILQIGAFLVISYSQLVLMR